MSFTNPQKKKSKGVRSGEQEGQGIGLSLPIQRTGNCPGRHEYNGRSEVMHHPTGKLFFQECVLHHN
jgi:hypothetical protein